MGTSWDACSSVTTVLLWSKRVERNSQQGPVLTKSASLIKSNTQARPTLSIDRLMGLKFRLVTRKCTLNYSFWMNLLRNVKLWVSWWGMKPQESSTSTRKEPKQKWHLCQLKLLNSSQKSYHSLQLREMNHLSTISWNRCTILALKVWEL